MSNILFTLEDIMAILPHREPFLFVDCVIQFKPDTMIMTQRHIRPDEPFFTGHFPQKPLMPGVLIVDALAQTSGLLWGFSKRHTASKSDSNDPDTQHFFLVTVNVKFPSPAFPHDTVIMTSYLIKKFGLLYSYNVEARVEGNVIAKGSLTLAMQKGSL